MASLIDCYQFLSLPSVKARLRELLLHLKLYEARVRELKVGIENIKKAGDDVKHKVDEEVNRHDRGILVKVEEWLEEVKATISEYVEFDGEAEDHELAVFDLFKSGYLPKTGIRYRRSTKAFAIIRKVNGLLQRANHGTLSYWLGPPSIAAFFHNVGYESFPSREGMMEKIKAALKSRSVRMIGLHGLSGVGKTTLVKEVAREALQASEAAKMFDVVAMASVTINPDIRKIQGQLADWLGMKLDEESDSARAARIRGRLKNEKQSTLIILDDLWAPLDLNMLGVPLENDDGDWGSRTKTMKATPSGTGNLKEGKTSGDQSMAKAEKSSSAINMMKSSKPSSASGVKTGGTLSHYKGCKVLLISESKQILSSQMEGYKYFIYSVEVLKEKEAQTLFKKMAGTNDRNFEFEKLAVQISNKCNGLPMSIVTAARALKSQSRLVWEDFHRQLEMGKVAGAFEFSTKLSYDLLENEELKYTFLLCARMGPDALMMDLVRYCIGLGFLQGIYTVKEARDRVYALVGKLKLFGLLSDSYSSDHFTMPGIVRGAALSIAYEERRVFTMTKQKIDEWPDDDKLERYAAISLHHCMIEGFPRSDIHYQRLKVFHVNNSDRSLKFPENFFNGMKELRVLILTGICISPLNSSIASLTELKMLSLEQCMLDKELSIIGELKKLRILSFSGSDIEKLPVQLKQLEKLQIFDISNCSKLREIPPNVISSLINLEELYMRNTLIWKVKEQTYQSENASLSELSHLNRLTTLDIQIPSATHLPKNLFFHMLYSYKIVIGDSNAYSELDFKMPEKYEASRFLAIQLKDDFHIHSQKGIKMLFERVEHLFLGNLNGVDDIFYRLNLKGFPYLKHLLVVNNSNIRSLIKPEKRLHPETVFSKLESLYLNELEKLVEICSCTCKLSAPSFGKLKVIKINLCGKLQSIFLISVVSLLTALETIEVSNCDDLMEIVTKETERYPNEIEVKFHRLCSLTLQSLSGKFNGFYPISPTGGPKILFSGKVVVPKLERMELSSIKINKIWTDQPPPLRSYFQNMVHLDVNGCGNLEYLISIPMAKSLENLQNLFVSECEKMSSIFLQGSYAGIKDSIFPNLKIFKLISMKRLGKIWNSALHSNSFDKLDTLDIEECDKLVNVFPCYMKGMFQNLSNLRVTNCKSMKAVFELGDDGGVTNLQDVYLETLPKLEHVWKLSKGRNGTLKLNNLQKMWVHDCRSLENIFPVCVARCLPRLEHLVIWSCFELREIVAKGKRAKTNTSNPDQFEFPRLTSIKFSELPKLECFYPGAYELSCPALNDLSIELCDRLDPFRKETTNAERPTLFSEQVINKLKSMQIESWHAKSSSSYMREGKHRQDKLEDLCLSRLMNPEILYSFLHNNPNLKSLSLNNCSFTDIVALKMPPEIENLGVVPTLKSLKLIDLPHLETIGFERDIILQWIESLVLKNCPCLVNIIPSSVTLTHLTNLEVVNCDGLEYLMPPSAAKSLVQLNSMKVIKCKSLVEIFGNEEENAGKVDTVFKQLKVLELVSLKMLNCFSKSCGFEFPLLEKLVVSACPKMQYFSAKVSNTPLLQKIYVVHEKENRGCWKGDIESTIEEIFQRKKFFEGMDEMSLLDHDDLLKAWRGGDVDLKSSSFCNLKTLKLEDCENLSCAIPSNMLSHLKSLKELVVRNCDQVEFIFENDADVIPSQLKNLTLEGLSSLKHVWKKNYQGNFRYRNLQQVFVSDCKILETLFPAALAKNLKKLEKLEIESCHHLLEIIGKEDVAADVEEPFVFPCLNSLDLFDLPELINFYPVECHELLYLQVLDCPKLELFQSAPHEVNGEGSSTSINRQPFFSNLKAISILELLSVDWKHYQVLKSMLPKLTEGLKCLKKFRMFFDVDDNKKPTLPIEILEKATHLQDMSIGCCKSLEMFRTGNPNISEQLKILTLYKVFELLIINLEDSWLNTLLGQIQQLSVISCPHLKELFHSPHAGSFSYLKELYINKCHSLNYLFTSSVARELVQLEKIIVKGSQSIQEIVAKEQDGITSQLIKFERLYWIDLEFLPNLEYFYSGNYTLELPSLTQVDIWQCPKMESFSRGKIILESFRGIQASSDPNDELVLLHDSSFSQGEIILESLRGIQASSDPNDELVLLHSDHDASVPHIDLNASVKRVFLLQMLSKGKEGMSFSRHPGLQEAWLGGLRLKNNLFYSLRTLKLDNCDNKQTQYAIPSNVLPCLKSLKELEVRNCNKVKVIFEMTGIGIKETVPQLINLTLEGLSELTLVWEKNYQEILRFQNLQQVIVIDCKSMQSLFPAVLAKNLKMLEKLDIQSCEELLEIVGKEKDAETDITQKFVFPHLTSLKLYELPKLTYFYREIFTVECPKLNCLSVLHCPKLELFQGIPPEGESKSISPSINRQPLFSDLKAISILKELFFQWKHISVLRLGQDREDLKFLKEIRMFFNVDENEKPTFPIEILEKAPNLQQMWIGRCKSLEVFHTQNCKISEHGILGQLKFLMLYKVSKIPYITLEDSWLNTFLGKLQQLNVSGCPHLKELFHSPHAASFSYLKELYINECHSLNYLFTSSVAEKLIHLEWITVQKCQSIKEIVAKEQDGTTSQGIKFGRLFYIDLDSLSNLECFYSGNDTLELPSLLQVGIWQCPKLDVFSRGKIISESFRATQFSTDLSVEPVLLHNDLSASVRRVFLLQILSEGMDETSFSKHPELQKAWHVGLCHQDDWFYNLTTLKLDECDIGKYAIPQNILPCLKSLKVLEVRNCNKVEKIFCMNDTEMTDIAYRLNNLTLAELSELTHVWDDCQGILRFRYLQQVNVSGCKSMQTLFPAALAKNLKILEKLQIQSCPKLREIFGEEEDAATDITKEFVFPHLTSLHLCDLPELASFYPELFTVECPKLNDLSVLNCPKLQLFQGTPAEGEDTSISTSVDRQTCFSDLKAISILEELSLDWKHFSVLWLGQHREDLKYLKQICLRFNVDENKKPTLPIEILEKAPNLQGMILEYCKSLEMFLTQIPKISEQGILGKLEMLKLIKVLELPYINLEDSWLNTFLGKLQQLIVSGCPHLKELFHSPSTVSFSCLKELSIDKCHSLNYLFTSSVAKVLMHLEQITVKESRSMKEIVEQDGTPSQGTKFERLYYIALHSLSSLECFYSGNDTLELPSLTRLDIRKCPKMEVFSQGEINSEYFRGVQASTDSNDELVYVKAINKKENDLNASVRRVFLLQILSEGMDEMRFSTHPELQEAWRGGLSLQNNWFYSLTTLKLDKCDIGQYVIPSNILPCLKSLKELEVRNCNKVKKIFDMNDNEIMDIAYQLNNLTLAELPELTHVWDNCQRILRFRYLQQVNVSSCKSMQTLFPASLAKNLKVLEKLEIHSCPKLREIVEKEEDATTDVTKKFVFPRLTSLLLRDLPELTCFCPGIFTVECPMLNKLQVLHCPMLEIFQSAPPLGEGEGSSTSINRQPLFSETVCNLTSLVVKGCNFLSNAILPCHLLPFLSKLKTLEVRKCNSVKAIFVYTKIEPQGSLSLPNLAKLCVENCEKLVEIVAMDETATEEANKENTMFPRLTLLRLWNLENLRCIYHGMHIVEWPMLKELHVTHCPMLKFFETKFQSSHDPHPECQDSFPTNQQVIVSLEKVAPCMEVLSLGKEEAKMIEQGKLHVDLQELNTLRLQCFHDDKTDVFPFVFGSKAPLPLIEKLVVRHSAFKEIFPSQTPDTDCTKILSQLKELELRSLSLLKSIGLEHSWMIPYLENLENLLVWNCVGLTNLTPSTVSFSNLILLDVKNCHGLRYLFTSSTAKTLRVLRELHIANCKLLKAVVAKEGDEYKYEKEEEEEEEDDDKGEGENECENEDEDEGENKDEDEGGGEDEDEDEGEGEGEGEGENKDEGVGEDEDEMIFQELVILKLSSLPKLESFYSGSSILKFPSLERVSFTQCYNTKVFRLGYKVPKDLKVTIDGVHTKGDIKSVIMQQLEEKKQSPDLAS